MSRKSKAHSTLLSKHKNTCRVLKATKAENRTLRDENDTMRTMLQMHGLWKDENGNQVFDTEWPPTRGGLRQQGSNTGRFSGRALYDAQGRLLGT